MSDAKRYHVYEFSNDGEFERALNNLPENENVISITQGYGKVKVLTEIIYPYRDVAFAKLERDLESD